MAITWGCNDPKYKKGRVCWIDPSGNEQCIFSNNLPLGYEITTVPQHCPTLRLKMRYARAVIQTSGNSCSLTGWTPFTQNLPSTAPYPIWNLRLRINLSPEPWIPFTFEGGIEHWGFKSGSVECGNHMGTRTRSYIVYADSNLGTNIVLISTSGSGFSVDGFEPANANDPLANACSTHAIKIYDGNQDLIYQKTYDSPPEFSRFICEPEEECPPGTCEVECHGKICCYNEQGISIKSFTR